MKHQKNVVICPPCGESVAVATKEGQNRKKTLWPLLPRLTAVLPPQGREISKGFTLIELLVVVLIIGILAAVALPQYQKAVEKANAIQAVTLLSAIYNAAQNYVLANDSWPTTFEQLDVESPWKDSQNKEVFGGEIRSNSGWSIQLYADATEDGIKWWGIKMERKEGKFSGVQLQKWRYNPGYGDNSFFCVEPSNASFNEGDYCLKILHAYPTSIARAYRVR